MVSEAAGRRTSDTYGVNKDEGDDDDGEGGGRASAAALTVLEEMAMGQEECERLLGEMEAEVGFDFEADIE